MEVYSPAFLKVQTIGNSHNLTYVEFGMGQKNVQKVVYRFQNFYKTIEKETFPDSFPTPHQPPSLPNSFPFSQTFLSSGKNKFFHKFLRAKHTICLLGACKKFWILYSKDRLTRRLDWILHHILTDWIIIRFRSF